MSNDINVCTFTGNLTRDSESSYTQSGTAMCKFSLAVNEKYGDTEYTSFFDFTIWGKFAEAVASYLTKGTPITVEAKAKQERWEKDGVKRNAVRFTVVSLKMHNRKPEDQGQSFGAPPSAPPTQPAGAPPTSFEDSIPF